MSAAGAPLRLCFVANAHSVHVQKFVGYFARAGHDVTLVTPEKCLYELPGVRLVNVTSLTASDHVRQALRELAVLRRLRRVRARLATELRHTLLPDPRLYHVAAALAARGNAAERTGWNAAAAEVAPVLGRVIEAQRPDIVQSLRFYPEGLICSAVDHARRVYFVWGSDLSGYGTWYPEVGAMMRAALQGCAGLVHDNAKDYRFALEFGLPGHVPHLLVPSNGGINTEHDPPPLLEPRARAPHFATFRRMGNLFMDNEPVLRALALLRVEHDLPATYTMYGSESGPYYDQLRVLARRLGVWRYVAFQPHYPSDRVQQVIARHPLQVSPAVDDGTSAALLETMWFGGIPIYSDVESIREWIDDGVNGYLFNMQDPAGLARQMRRAWDERGSRGRMVALNRGLVRERADYQRSMARVLEFYRSLL